MTLITFLVNAESIVVKHPRGDLSLKYTETTQQREDSKKHTANRNDSRADSL